MAPIGRCALISITVAALTPAIAFSQAVTTYHNDTLRTGWNAAETLLTTANVAGGGFNLLATTKLDSQVDAQPLVVPDQVVGSYSARTIVYVATGGDTLYAIDGVTGVVLASRSFGTPVPQSALPGQCNNNGPSVGITSTPVINTASGTLYLVVDTYESGHAVFRVHGVSLSTLQDSVAPVIVSASARLADGTEYNFNPDVSRQRAALLLSGSTLYAAFSSYCDLSASATRGWMLGWTTPSLSPLAHNNLTDTVPNSQSSFFLNSIWMSGYGPSTASANNTVYVVTSNSDKNTYGAGNLDESVLKFSADLSGTQSHFTDPNRAALDQGDSDLGAGGAMLSPPEPGQNPKLLWAAGKGGSMYMLDRSAGAGLGVLGTYSIGPCWCGPSYYTGSDGTGRVISSGGANVIVWRVNTSSTASASLTQHFKIPITSGQEGGFFTSISSNGTVAGTTIVWAVGRPTKVPGTVPLYAIDPTTGHIIYTQTAGTWAAGNSNANTVASVSLGHVYVATNQEMTIFGLGAQSPAATMQARGRVDRPQGFALPTGNHAVWGIVRTIGQTELQMTDRVGRTIRVYLPAARAAGNVAEPVVGEAAVAIGTRAQDDLLVASSVAHAKPSPSLWPTDQ